MFTLCLGSSFAPRGKTRGPEWNNSAVALGSSSGGAPAPVYLSATGPLSVAALRSAEVA